MDPCLNLLYTHTNEFEDSLVTLVNIFVKTIIVAFIGVLRTQY